MTPYITARAQEINNHLDWIQASKLQGRDAYNAVANADPELASALLNYVAGDEKVPSSARFNELKQRIIGLGHKMDPTFNEGTAQTRYATMRDFTTGLDGRTLTSIGTAYHHIAHALDILKNPPSLIARKWGGGPITGLVTSDETAAALGHYNNAINTAVSEYERALIGGKPTQTGREEQARETDWAKMDPRVIKADLEDKMNALKVRAQQLQGQFSRGIGRTSIDKAFENFEKDPSTGWEAGSADGLRQINRWQPDPMGCSVSQSHPDDQRAIDWARMNPNDPRSKQILQMNGIQ
jgi:hypothetical protein